MTDSLTIDGVGPMPVERPATVAELCAIVRRCAETKTAIYPVGGGTMLDYGMPPARLGIALSTAGLGQVIDYPARDLTITVQAGITMQKLQETLAAENQWLPIDIPEAATIGGAIACDVSGPRRYGYGTLRDYVIGITVVNDRGEEAKAGGRVVKNVAGYDMMKLHTGALGTLGVITQVTLKVKPKPEATLTITAGFDDEQIVQALHLMSGTPAAPVAIAISSLYPSRNWGVLADFAGNSEAVRWQLDQFQRELELAGYSMIFRPRCSLISTTCSSRAMISPSAVSDYCMFTRSLHDHLEVIAFPTIGVVRVNFLFTDQWALPHVQSMLGQLGDKSAECGGNAIIDHCPLEWKFELPVWGGPPADLALQKAVKQALDPQNLFNPGRFVTDCF